MRRETEIQEKNFTRVEPLNDRIDGQDLPHPATSQCQRESERPA